MSAGLRAHLETCPSCRNALERMRADTRFLRGFAVNGTFPTVSAPPSHHPEIPGYDIVREIHRGGQGVVYQAVQRSTKRDVAIKVMRQGPFATLSDRTRFEREIAILGKLQHPNIVAVHDAGAVSGFHYFVMNYVDGHPLDELWGRTPPTPSQIGPSAEHAPGGGAGHVHPPGPERLGAAVLELFIKVCTAVHAAHLRGIIHRDLKPSNIRVDQHGEPHVLDFGLAKTIEAEADSAMTRTGQFVGSLPWASPEQIEGASARIDLRTDVYSLGVLLFQLLTGQLPFDMGSDLRKTVESIMFREPTRPSAVAAASGGPRINDELDTIVLKCLSKDRERRYHTAGELARDLRRYLAGEAIEAKRDSAAYVLRKTLKRYRLPVAIAVLSMLLLGAFSVVMAVLYRRATLLEAAAARESHELAAALSQSTIERGRLLAAAGSVAVAEPLLWQEYLSNPADTPNGRQARWALRELYSRNPCVATWLVANATPCEPQFVGNSNMLRFLDSAGRLRAWPVDKGTPQEVGAIGVLPDAALFASSGEQVLVCEGDAAVLWSEASGQRLQEMHTDGDRITTLALAATGTQLALGTAGGAIHLIDARSGQRLAVWTAHTARLASLCFTSSGDRLFSCGYDTRLCIWDGRTGEAVAERTLVDIQPRMQIGNLVASPDDARLALSLRWSILICDAHTLEQQTTLEGSLGAIQGLDFGPSGRWLASAGIDKRIVIWDVDQASVVRTLAGHTGAYKGVAFNSDGAYLASAATDGAVRVWETGLTATHPLGVVTEIDYPRSIQEIVLTAAGDELLAASEDGLVWSADPHSGQRIRTYQGHTDVAYSIALAPDGQHFATCGSDGTLRLWERNTDTPLRTIDFRDTAVYPDPRGLGPSYVPHCVVYAPHGGELIVGGDDGLIARWDLADNRIGQIITAHPQRITAVRYAPDGQSFFSASMDGTIAIWDAATGRELRRLRAHSDGVRALDIRRDGQRMASGGDDATVRIWDIATGTELCVCTGHRQDVFTVRISRDGGLLASGERGRAEDGTSAIIIWDTETGRDLLRLGRHSDMVFALDFSPDGRQLVSCGRDQRILVHDLGHFDRHIAGNEAAFRHRLAQVGIDPQSGE